jgi:hypothetical protein
LKVGIALLTLSAILVSGCGSSPTSPTNTPTAPAATFTMTTVSFTSDAQDFVGQGQSRTFTLQDSVFVANLYQDGGYLSIVIRPAAAATPLWGLTVAGPGGSRIAPGTYQSSQSTFFFSGDGRGCSESTGQIVIHAFDYIPENLALKNFRASFQQRCQGATGQLRGEVAILADPWR